MTSKNRVYFPIDENLSLICLASSKTGIVLPLDQFGYPNVHFTVYIKDMKTKQGYQKISLHLKDQKADKIIAEYLIEFDEEIIKKKYAEKITKWIKSWISIVKKYIVKADTLNDRIICYDCYINDNFSGYSLHRRDKAIESYKDMFDKIKNIKYQQFQECNNSNHRLLMDLNTGTILYKSVGGIFKYSNSDEMLAELDVIFSDTFSDELKILELVKVNFSRALEKYKVIK
jgi:hypothetical protein